MVIILAAVNLFKLKQILNIEILSSSESKSVEEIRQNFAIDWRVKKPFFDDQISHFCMKDEMADVEFVFNRQNKITVCFSYIKAIYFFTYLEDSSP